MLQDYIGIACGCTYVFQTKATWFDGSVHIGKAQTSF